MIIIIYIFYYFIFNRGPLMIFMDMEMPELTGCEVTNKLLNDIYSE